LTYRYKHQRTKRIIKKKRGEGKEHPQQSCFASDQKNYSQNSSSRTLNRKRWRQQPVSSTRLIWPPFVSSLQIVHTGGACHLPASLWRNWKCASMMTRARTYSKKPEDRNVGGICRAKFCTPETAEEWQGAELPSGREQREDRDEVNVKNEWKR
jgi:hypothetical protein